jgi:hypothetical protein
MHIARHLDEGRVMDAATRRMSGGSERTDCALSRVTVARTVGFSDRERRNSISDFIDEFPLFGIDLSS